MNIENKRIGIWGFGVVGKSALRFFSQKTQYLSVMDQRRLSADEQTFLENQRISFYPQNESAIERFFNEHDYILVSPGVDLRPFKQYRAQFINELDLFQTYFNKPIIAVTGTVGKTTVTHLLTKALEQCGNRIACGGNMGMGMLDLLDRKDTVDYALLEISSFQLEQTNIFAPELAIITNIYANHLDRHSSMHEYIEAKLSMIRRQQSNQKALISTTAKKWIDSCSLTVPNHAIYFGNDLEEEKIIKTLPKITAVDNWVTIISALKVLNQSIDNVTAVQFDQTIQEHRLEYITTINDVAFYNDSKSTITQSTISAASQLHGKPIILLLGGINKAADKKQDRLELIQQLPKNVKYVAAFGAEAELIKEISSVSCDAFATLEEAFKTCTSYAQSGDQILLSPGGSSYDLYANYKERGHHFKQLIKSYTD